MLTFLLLATLSAAEPAPKFEKALARLERAKTWKKNTVHDAAEISLYRGLCRYQQGDERSARAELRRALQLDPTVELPPLTSPKIRAVFEEELAAVRPAGTTTGTVATTTTTAAPLVSPPVPASVAPAALAPPPAPAKAAPALSKNHMPWLFAVGAASAFAAAGGWYGYSASSPGGSGGRGYKDGVLLEALFQEPEAIAPAPGGGFYVTDARNNRIRRVMP